VKDLNEDQIKILDAFAEIYEQKSEESHCGFIGCLDEICFKLKNFVDKTGFTKYKVTKLRKELVYLGYMEFIKGLLSENSGGYFGSGYFLTKKSLDYVERKVIEIEGKRFRNEIKRFWAEIKFNGGSEGEY